MSTDSMKAISLSGSTLGLCKGPQPKGVHSTSPMRGFNTGWAGLPGLFPSAWVMVPSGRCTKAKSLEIYKGYYSTVPLCTAPKLPNRPCILPNSSGAR